MPKQLTTQNASITTVAVEVKALTISGKQVTLSVFRQLPEEPLLADDCTLNGLPWGVVNYHPDKCADAADHRHVVWQRDDQLLRSAIYTPAHSKHHTAAAGALVEAAIASEHIDKWERTHPVLTSLYFGRPEYPGASAHIQFRHGGVRFYGEICGDAWFAASGRGDARQRLEERVRASVPPAELLESLPVLQYQDAWQAVLRLPQLFIAV